MPTPRRRIRRFRFLRVAPALALLAALGFAGGYAPAVRIMTDLLPAAEAADWKGEIGLFQFGYDDAGAWRMALVKGDPKGRTLQGTVARQAIFWSCVQPRQGAWELEKCRQIKMIDQLQDAGWRVQVVLRTKRGEFGKAPFWATGAAERGDKSDASHAPSDLRDAASPEFGYSETYYAFVRRVLDYYCDGAACRIHSLVIENEANADDKWRGRGNSPENDVEDYVRLVATARKAVDDSGARIALYDSGLQGSAILWNVVEEHGKKGVSEATAAYRKAFNESMAPGEMSKKLGKRGNNPTNRKILLMLESDLYRYTDGLNFHHYQTPESVAELIDFLRRHGPAGHPLVANEVGIKSNIIKDESPDLVNAWMIQKLVYLFDAGVSPIVWFTVPAGTNIGSFVDDNKRFKPAAADAYNVFAERVGAGLTEVSVDSATAGGRPLVRARLQGSAGPFAVEWFADGAAGDWAGVAPPAGCDADAAPYRTGYLRILDCR